MYSYKNGKMRPVETIPGKWGRGTKENDEGGDSTMIYYKNFYKCNNVPPVQQQYDNKKINVEM
jgi:hypothetical protein